LKASTLFYLIFLLIAALNSPRLAPHAYAQARDPGGARAAGPPSRSTVRGRVVYADTGNPVRRAEVILMNAGTGERLGGAVTNVKGEFSFKNLPGGRYSLAATAPSLVDRSVLPHSDSATDLLDFIEEQNSLTEVEVDGLRGADVVIRARRGGAITGRVTSEDDEPVAGAQLRLFRLRRGQLTRVASTWQTLSSDKRYLTTDSRGVYRLGGLPAGEYIVRASESDLGPGGAGDEGDVYADGSLIVSYFPSAGVVKDAVPVRVYEGRDTERVDIRIPDRPARKIGGAVTLKRGGFPVAGAEITVSRKDEGPFPQRGFGEESARTGPDGRWEVFGVTDGEYILTVGSVISVVAAGPGGMRSVQVVPVRREITISGADATDLKLEVDEGRRVSGTVSVEGGGGLPDFLRVEAVRNGEEVDWTLPRDKGQFVLDNVPAGEVRLRVSGFPEDRFYVKSVTWNQADLTREPLRVGDGAGVEGVRVVLSADVATLNGQAFSGRDATSPLAHAVVALVPADERTRRATARPRVVRADARGRFEIAAGPGEYLIIALPEKTALQQSVRIDEEYIRRTLPSLTRVSLRAGGRVSGVKVFGREE
jgi:hypothetical protein